MKTYEERFGKADPERFDTPMSPVRVLYSQEQYEGWNPEMKRPADWRDREKPKPIAESRPDYLHVVMGSPAQKRTCATNIKPPKPAKPIKSATKKYCKPTITPQEVIDRRRAGESSVQIAASLGCSRDWVVMTLKKAGYAKACGKCGSTNLRSGAAKLCGQCRTEVDKKQKRDVWRSKHGKGMYYRGSRSPKTERGNGAHSEADTGSGIGWGTPAVAGQDGGAGQVLDGGLI